MSESVHPGTSGSPAPERQHLDGAAATEPGRLSAIQAARAQADSQIDKAQNDRRTSAQKDFFLFGVPAFFIGFAALLGLVTWKTADPSDSPPFNGWWLIGALAVLVLGGLVAGVRGVSRTAVVDEVVRTEELNVRLVELDFVPDADAPLASNRELLREYHRLSTTQARAAFRLAIWVMGASALLVLAGAGAVVASQNTATAVTLGALTAFISALGGYVSSTLLATYRVSVEQARFYFREPLAGGYLLAAEHLAKRLDTPEHTAALGRVVDGFIQAATNVPGALPDPTPHQAPPHEPTSPS